VFLVASVDPEHPEHPFLATLVRAFTNDGVLAGLTVLLAVLLFQTHHCLARLRRAVDRVEERVDG
jgi:hypothetical protein